MSQTIITAGDASNGLVSSAGNDGTIVIQSGPAGSKVNAVSFAADGTPTLLKVPAVSTPQSMIRVNSTNGYGSTNTCIARFVNVFTNQGSDITYTDSATLGGSFTVNTSGVYALSLDSCMNVANAFSGISLNTTQPSTSIGTISVGERLAKSQGLAITSNQDCSWCGYIAAGSVVRVHTDGNAFGPAALNQFTITRVA